MSTKSNATTFFSACMCMLFGAVASFAADDWPVWRGPNLNNTASNQNPPTTWDESTNIIWKAKVPGRGHASPTIVGDRIFLATAEKSKQIQSVVCFDKNSGKQLWQTPVLEGNFPQRIHNNNSHASQTILTANDRMFVVFNNSNSIFLAALDFDGNILWEENTGSFSPKYPFGFGSSPCLYENLVIVLSDYPRSGYLAAYDQASGNEVWRTKRGHTSSYATPIVANVAGTDQLLVSGSQLRSYNPATGEENWNVDAPQWQVSCITPTWYNDLVFISGGFPGKGTYAISAKNKSIVWENQVKSYEQSLLAHDGYVYCHSDNGIVYCWRASDGKEMWKERATPGRVSASPVLAGDLIFLTGEKGRTTVIKADPSEYQVVANNQLGVRAFATPAFVDNKIFTRVTVQPGSESQFLYCIGEK